MFSSVIITQYKLINFMKEIDKILDTNEQKLWEGHPEFAPYFFSIWPIVLFGLPFLVAGSLALYSSWIESNGWLLLLPHFWFGLAMVFGATIYSFLAYKYTHYAITNKRVIFQAGLIGRDFQMIDFDQITNVEVNVGVLDKIFGQNSGSILISSAGNFMDTKHGPVAKPYVLSNVTNPYEVFKFLKHTSHDIKTDISYPNKFRPGENPGYQSEYKPQEKI